MLPPVPLREPMTVNGLKVDLGFTPYSEMLNGRVAMLGLAALVLVELGSGKGLLSYHAPPVLFLQVYTVAALSAIFVKFEKERISVWPEKSPVEVEEESTVTADHEY
ncbi:uncharacterized protein A4U43_C07F3270 [Asparagus officinalis]|uniref:Uncharacterized protein n=1 Tax=Asparagus officinalis TaxID=4686 RepID=A0A5P1EC57_ASPOF|nr:uncharacterized protein A4U43_C07F3270 [Asparagus officinalis]